MVGRYRITVYDAVNDAYITMATAFTWQGALRKGRAVMYAEAGRMVGLWRGARRIGSL